MPKEVLDQQTGAQVAGPGRSNKRTTRSVGHEAETPVRVGVVGVESADQLVQTFDIRLAICEYLALLVPEGGLVQIGHALRSSS